MLKDATAFQKWYARICEDPIVFAEEALRCIDDTEAGPNNPRLTTQQVELLECVKKETFLPLHKRKKRIAVKSGKGTGKTTCENILALWRVFLSVDNQVVVTAPTDHQIKDVWFSEMRRILQNAHPMIQEACKMTSKKLEILGRPNWRIIGKTSSKPENFQGFHCPQLTIIVDEASGVDRAIFKVIKGTLTNHDSLLVCAGNPNTRECSFFDMFYKPSEAMTWHKFTFNAEDSPITDKENIRRLGAEFGTNSDTYRLSVLGEFPIADPNCVMSTEDLWACTGTSMVAASRMKSTGQGMDKAIGIDFARFGSDESVIYRRVGNAVVEWKTYAHTEPVAVARKAMEMQKKAGWLDRDCVYVVDAGGMGQGVLGLFYENKKRVHEFHTQGRSSVPDYGNKLTEAYFHIGKLAKQRRLYIPDDEHLIHQLSSRLYETDIKGKMVLEDKKQFVKRMEGQSPDRADSLVMAFYRAVFIGGQSA